MKSILVLTLLVPTLAQAQGFSNTNPYDNNYIPQPPPTNTGQQKRQL